MVHGLCVEDKANNTGGCRDLDKCEGIHDGVDNAPYDVMLRVPANAKCKTTPLRYLDVVISTDKVPGVMRRVAAVLLMQTVTKRSANHTRTKTHR